MALVKVTSISKTDRATMATTMQLGALWWMLLVLVQPSAGSKRCFECADVPHPADCKLVTICADYEKCVTREYISSGGLVLYSSGCESKTRCASFGKRDVSLPEKRQTTDIVVCEECCDGEFCNMQGCGIAAAPQPRGPFCFNCPTLDDPADCRTVTECERGQVCAIQQILHSTQYLSKCMRDLTCNATSHAYVQSGHCFRCCTADFCNDSCTQPSG
ncbi:uncharacterized protein LOC128222657 [Mya arenaria]|uniref:uncharacterized protein LOC128222657 n=1 Tax=Mya arenaria TaxID=6604 RepID=UPI0022E52009|nr:uncharacterized protein LOC128222657 [Mya arenaria]